MHKLFTGIVYLLSFIIGIGGLVIHIWTLIIAYHISGILGAIVTFFLIGLSEIYWCYEAWRTSGFDSPYIQWIFAFIILGIIRFIFAMIAAVFDKE